MDNIYAWKSVERQIANACARRIMPKLSEQERNELIAAREAVIVAQSKARMLADDAVNNMFF